MSDTVLTVYTSRDHNSKSLQFNIFLAGYTLYTRTSTNRRFKYSGLERHCSDSIFSTRRDHNSKSLRFNIFFAGYTRYTSTSTNQPLKYSGLERHCSDSIFSTRYFQPGATINRNRLNSIFSSLGTLVLQVRVRIFRI